MKIQSRNLNRYGALSVLCIGLAICFANCLGMFRASDEYCYDWILATKPSASSNRDILLVYAPRSFFLEPQCGNLAELAGSLAAFDAKTIGILFEPDRKQLENLKALPFSASLVTGASRTLTGKTSSDTPATGEIKQGFIDLQLDQSIYREHRAQTAGTESLERSFESVIASQFLPASALLPREKFGIRFVGGPDSLPNVHADEILNKEIVSELVKDKIVLIGLEQTEEIGFVTPTTHSKERMSRLELHGNILCTLQLQNQLRSSGLTVSIAILLVVTFFSCQLFRQISQQNIFRSYLACLTFVALLGWTTFHFGSFKLPLTGMILGTSLTLSTSLYFRFKTLNEFFDSWSLMRQTGSQTDWKAEEKDTWTLISDSVYQNFYPNRMVLMEVKRGATHLTTTKTIHCTEDHILERRRDFTRAPYREAVELGAAMEIEFRQFFTVNEETECIEYIAPLIVVSELVGFMVLEMTAESVKNWNDFENFLTLFSNDMAVLVNKYRVLQQQESREQKLLEKLKDVPEEIRKQAVFQGEIELRNMETLLGDAFERIQTAGAIFDVFGRTIKTNAKMIELLQRNAIVVGDTDSIGILETLTGWEKNECRKLFRNTVVEARTQEIFLTPEKGQDAPRVLYLEPLNKGEDEPEISSRCVCIQVVEGKIFEDSLHWQHDFVSDNAHEVAKRLEKLDRMVARLQSSNELGGADRDCLELDILTAISDCRQILGKKFGQDPKNCVLFDSLSVWQTALDRVRPDFDVRGIKVSQRFEQSSLEAVANPILLQQVFETALACVSHEASEKSEILVTAQRIDTKVVFQFSDVAGDAPIKGLRKSLDLESHDETQIKVLEGNSVSVLTPSQIDRCREIEGWLQCWEAKMSIRCCAHYRINIELALNTEIGSSGGYQVVSPNKSTRHDTLTKAAEDGGRV